MLDIGTIQRQQYIPFSLSGGIEYTSPGTYSFVVPANIYLMSGVFVAPGGVGNGGDLRWINNFPVTPGETLTVTVGAYAVDLSTPSTMLKRSTNTIVIASQSLSSSTFGAGPFGGSIGGGNGGAGASGGGGAGGYSGNGGAGNSAGSGSPNPGNPGTGGGGGSGTSGFSGGGGSYGGSAGGGVGLYGEGNNGYAGGGALGQGGGGGSGGTKGYFANMGGAGNAVNNGGNFGGGRGINILAPDSRQRGGNGGARLIWGTGRAFPSLNVGKGSDIGGGSTSYTTGGTYSWTCPAGVFSVCVVCVGAGGSHRSGPGGGGLGWKNNIPVVPGQSYTVVVGAGGISGLPAQNYYAQSGGHSYFINTSTVAGFGGSAGSVEPYGDAEVSGAGGGYVGDGGGNGGNGSSGGAGGAGGYSGNGGNGGQQFIPDNNTAGSGGGGGGGRGPGSTYPYYGGAGGGVGIWGEGTSGARGTGYTTIGQDSGYNNPGLGGSGGGSGTFAYAGTNSDGLAFQNRLTRGGGNWGGGGGNGATRGGEGAVRIVWGYDRSFPSNRVSDQYDSSFASEYITPGTYSWTAPAGVTSVSVVAVGSGGGGYYQNYGGGAGGGGGLGWKNNIAVTPGQSYTVVAGAGGSAGGSGGPGGAGNTSYFINTSTVRGGGATAVYSDGTGAAGGDYAGDGGGNGGAGGRGQGGGGAGGYTGAGGAGGAYTSTVALTIGNPGNGGGGAGGNGQFSGGENASPGGGVGIWGQGANGVPAAVPVPYTISSFRFGSGGGSGGSGGSGDGGAPAWGNIGTSTASLQGGTFGGGGGGSGGQAGAGGGGGVRIIWGPSNPTIHRVV